MNGIAVRGGAPPEVASGQLARLMEFARGDDRLGSWRREEYGLLHRSIPLPMFRFGSGRSNGRRVGWPLRTHSLA